MLLGQEMEKLKKIFLNTLYQSIGKAATALITIATTAVLSRNLGGAGFGDFAKITVFVGFFYLLADFGFNAIFLKESQDFKTFKIDLSRLFGLRIMLAGILMLIAIVSGQLLPSFGKDSGFSTTVKIGIAIFSLTIFLQALITCANAAFQFRLRYDRSVISTVVGSLAGLILVLLFRENLTVVLAVVIVAFANLTAFIVAFMFLGRSYGFVNPIFDTNYIKGLFLKSWPLGLTLVFNVLYFRLDIIILALFRSSSEVGFYGLAYRIFENLIALPIFFVNALYPIWLADFAKDRKKFLLTFKTSILILAAGSLVVAGLIFLLANFLVLLIGGVDFRPAGQLLQILLLGLPLFYLSAIFMWFLIVIGRQKLLPLIYGGGAVVNIGLNLIFIPKFGAAGAAAITVVAEFLILALLVTAAILNLKHVAVGKIQT